MPHRRWIGSWRFRESLPKSAYLHSFAGHGARTFRQLAASLPLAIKLLRDALSYQRGSPLRNTSKAKSRPQLKSLWAVLCVFADLGVFARNPASGAKKSEGQISRKDAKVRKDNIQYSYRSAIIGSTFAARLVGRQYLPYGLKSI